MFLAQFAIPPALAQTHPQQQSKPGSTATTKMEDVPKWSHRRWKAAKAKWSQEKTKWHDCQREANLKELSEELDLFL
jgi:hypothetical protein